MLRYHHHTFVALLLTCSILLFELSVVRAADLLHPTETSEQDAATATFWPKRSTLLLCMTLLGSLLLFLLSLRVEKRKQVRVVEMRERMMRPLPTAEQKRAFTLRLSQLALRRVHALLACTLPLPALVDHHHASSELSEKSSTTLTKQEEEEVVVVEEKKKHESDDEKTEKRTAEQVIAAASSSVNPPEHSASPTSSGVSNAPTDGRSTKVSPSGSSTARTELIRAGQREAERLDAEAHKIRSDLATENPGFFHAARSGAKTAAAFRRLLVSEQACERYARLVADQELARRSQASVAKQFKPIKQGTHCLFASKAKVTCCYDFQPELSLEENLLLSIPLLLDFSLHCDVDRLDAFLLQFRGKQYGTTYDEFCETMHRALYFLNEFDPLGDRVMDAEQIGRRGWRYRWNDVFFFVTSVAPCFEDWHPRYAFGEKECSYIIFQPVSSFGHHNIGDYDSDIRWKIRDNFTKHNRPFWIRGKMPRFYPYVWNFLPPSDFLTDRVIKQGPSRRYRWWLPAEERFLEEGHEEITPKAVEQKKKN